MRFIVSPEEDGAMLSVLVLRHAEGIPPWAFKAAIKAKDIRVNRIRIEKDQPVFCGQEISVFFPKEAIGKTPRRLEEKALVFEDENIVIVNKPQGVATQNDDNPLIGDTVLTRTKALLNGRGYRGELYPCHRLDIQTGGLLIMAKTEPANQEAILAFKNREILKTYTCLVKGCPHKKEETLYGYLRKDAILSRVCITESSVSHASPITTRYRVIEAGDISRLEVDLVTGKTHQIRAHLAHIGHPILGDDKYGDRKFNHLHGIYKQQLWATRVRFDIQKGMLSYLKDSVFEVVSPF